uniref:calcium-binding protein n=1 Tax=Pseudomonas sp. ML96 TaxID=1523503 RepID=UPI0012E06BE1
MSYIGQYERSSSADMDGLHITDTEGYSADIDPSGKVTFTDRFGNKLDFNPSSANVTYNAGSSTITVGADSTVTLSAKAGIGEIKTKSQINPDGSISLSEVTITATAVDIGNGVASIGVAGELKWTPEGGWTYGLDGEIKILGKSITDIAEAAYNAVEDSWLGRLAGSRDEWTQEYLNGETTDSYLEWLKKKNQNSVDSDVNSDFMAALNFVMRRDPLALDLDGDGIETVGANSGITFDFDGDGLETGTGWIKGDDGFLTLDLNGNGVIDTGAELFGVDTIKSNGQKATDGFDALRELDSNADGVFDIQDAQFANVRVWQDLNQDGNSQANELKSLEELDIVAINLDSSPTRLTSNGNIINATGTFVHGDGSVGGLSDNQSLAANLDLASNPFYREFTDQVALTDQAKALPGMQGSGAVRDLREAIVGSEALTGALTAYASASTRQEQFANLDALVRAWAGTSDFSTWDERIALLGSERLDVRFAYSWERPVNDGVGSGSVGGTAGGGSALTGGSNQEEPTAAQLEKQNLLEKIRILEIFNGQNFFNFSSTSKTDATGKESASFQLSSGTISRSFSMLVGSVRTVYLTEEDFTFNAEQIRLLNSAYENLMQSVYEGLLLQTRLKPYYDNVSLSVTEAGLSWDYSGAIERFTQVHENNPIKAIVDLLEFGAALTGRAGWSGDEITLAGDWVRQLDATQYAVLQAQLGSASSILFANSASINGKLTGGVSSDFLFGAEANDTLAGNDGGDFLEGAGGNDYLYGGAGNDWLNGGEGSDRLYGENGNDQLRGADGSDHLYGGNGNDILDGGAGNDSLSGDAGSDVYRFSRGWGQDTINNYDTSTGKVDAIE